MTDLLARVPPLSPSSRQFASPSPGRCKSVYRTKGRLSRDEWTGRVVRPNVENFPSCRFRDFWLRQLRRRLIDDERHGEHAVLLGGQGREKGRASRACTKIARFIVLVRVRG